MGGYGDGFCPVSAALTADIVKQGAAIIVQGYPKRDGTKEMRAEWIEIDGKRYPLR